MTASTKSGPKGGRPRKISPQDALALAEQVFWRTGLAGSTLEDISGATSLPRASIAATFGDKRALYLAALRERAAANAAGIGRLLSREAPIAETLARLFAAALTQYLEGTGGAQGCFMLSTALTPARTDRAVADVLLDSIASTERLIRERFVRDGFPDATERAAQTAATLHYLAIRARGGDSPEALREHARASAAWLSS